MSDPQPPQPRPRRGSGFRHAARLVEGRVKAAGQSRGFSVARLLTHWEAIVGPEAARLARPVRLSWGRGRGGARRAEGLGATLTLAAPGAAAPILQMMLPQIRERVNAAMGHAAVARIVLNSAGGAPGFAEAQAGFARAPRGEDPGLGARAAAAAAEVQDPALRAALESLARNVLSRSEHRKGQMP